MLLGLQYSTVAISGIGLIFVILELVTRRHSRVLKRLFAIFILANYVFFTFNGDLFEFYDRQIYQLRMLSDSFRSVSPSFIFTNIYRFFWLIDPFWGVSIFTISVVVVKIYLIYGWSPSVGPLYLYFTLSHWYDDYQQIKFGFAIVFIFFLFSNKKVKNLILAMSVHLAGALYVFVGASKYISASGGKALLVMPLVLHLSLIFGTYLDIFSIVGRFIPASLGYQAYYLDAINGSQENFNLFRITNLTISLTLAFLVFTKRFKPFFSQAHFFILAACCTELFYQLFIFSPTVSGRMYHVLEIAFIPLIAMITVNRYYFSSYFVIFSFGVYFWSILKLFANINNGYFTQVY